MRVSSLLVLVVTLAGCAAELRPAPTAQVLPGPGRPATAAAAGVRVVAQTGVWQAYPPALDSVVTPMLVTVAYQRARSHLGRTRPASSIFRVCLARLRRRISPRRSSPTARALRWRR